MRAIVAEGLQEIYFKDGGRRADHLEAELNDIDYIDVAFQNCSRSCCDGRSGHSLSCTWMRTSRLMRCTAGQPVWTLCMLGSVGIFRRSEPRRRAREYLRGLLAPLERKNGWTLTEQAGELCPDGMQRLLNQADWNADEVRGLVLEHLGAEDGVLAVDESGFIKKGTRSPACNGSTPTPLGPVFQQLSATGFRGGCSGV